MDNERRIAVLIDADNVSQKYLKHILDETANYGVVTYKRIYGDWTSSKLSSWKQPLLEHSVMPIQQYSYTTGKNATDSALIIDAMDILYSGSVEGFCIVSSDSDFTRLAARLREAGMFVVGMGEKKTPRPFVSACEKFKYLEALSAVIVETAEKIKEGGENQETRNTELIASIRNIVSEISDDDGWAFMGEVGAMLNKRYPDFDTRNYGFSKLTPLVSSLNSFEVVSRKTGAHNKSYFVRNK